MRKASIVQAVAGRGCGWPVLRRWITVCAEVFSQYAQIFQEDFYYQQVVSLIPLEVPENQAARASRLLSVILLEFPEMRASCATARQKRRASAWARGHSASVAAVGRAGR
jgi:hypothetical protein